MMKLEQLQWWSNQDEKKLDYKFTRDGLFRLNQNHLEFEDMDVKVDCDLRTV